MRKSIQHNVLTISEMTRKPNRLVARTIDYKELVINKDTLKELRASKSMFNKSTYIQININNDKFNIDDITKQGNGNYKISLISHNARATLVTNKSGFVIIQSISHF